MNPRLNEVIPGKLVQNVDVRMEALKLLQCHVYDFLWRGKERNRDRDRETEREKSSERDKETDRHINRPEDKKKRRHRMPLYRHHFLISCWDEDRRKSERKKKEAGTDKQTDKQTLCGPDEPRIQIGVLGHSLVRSLVGK